MYSRLLVPIDGSETSHLALREATKLASLAGATVVLLHVAEDLKHCSGFESPQAYIKDVQPHYLAAAHALLGTAEAELRSHRIKVETRVVESRGAPVAEVIVSEAQAQHTDLIILGTHGRHGIDRLMLGSDAEQVARSAPVPVMLVRGRPDSPR